MITVGSIYACDIDSRYFSMIIENKLVYFYLQNSLIKKFKKYLNPGRFVSFEYDETIKVINKRKCYHVEHFIKIIRQKYRNQETYYDIDVIKDGIKDFINGIENVMFLDLEMTMQDYSPNPNFVAEIIQAGYVVYNKNEEIIDEGDCYIKPTKFSKLSKRTMKFLKISQEVFDDALSYNEFYTKFDSIIDKYNPYIIVWGRNDILALKESYKINELESLEKKSHFVNLLQIIKNYYNLKNDLGLFKALKLFADDEYDQAHDALDDAIVTKRVFYEFRKAVNGKEYNIPKE